jgi:selenocysteine lyase/cysteine desulfurase
VLLLDTAYGSVKKMVRELCGESQGVTVIQVTVPFPLASEDDLVTAVGQALDTYSGKFVKLAVFDHITSASGLTLPVQKLVQLCHHHGVQASSVNVFMRIVQSAAVAGAVLCRSLKFNSSYMIRTCAAQLLYIYVHQVLRD